jgi:hypothetical protein
MVGHMDKEHDIVIGKWESPDTVKEKMRRFDLNRMTTEDIGKWMFLGLMFVVFVIIVIAMLIKAVEMLW